MNRVRQVFAPGSLTGLLLVAIAIAVILRVLNLSSREFWYDEILSILYATGHAQAFQSPDGTPVPLGQYRDLVEFSGKGALHTLEWLIKGVAAKDPHPPLSYLGLSGWLQVLGNSDAAARGFIATISLGTIASAYGLGRRLLGSRGGLLLAALLSANPFFLYHSLNLRMYGLLLLWTVLSAWAVLVLAKFPPEAEAPKGWRQWGWTLVLIGAIAAGLLTQYLFFYWVIALVVLVLYLDWRYWWQHTLRFAVAGILVVPWTVWGARQQLNNRGGDIGSQVSGGEVSGLGVALKHLENLTKTLGAHLWLGSWVTSLPLAAIVIAGAIALALLVLCTVTLWRQGNRRLLGVVLILGLFPLALSLTIDILTGGSITGFGGGRSLIFILPGCLLLIAFRLERFGDRWRNWTAAGLLLVYLSIGISDFALRNRRMFSTVAAEMGQDSPAPTLVLFNAKAWGHVLRVARYLPTEGTTLLGDKSATLAESLESAFAEDNSADYPRLVWLDMAAPVWSDPTSDEVRSQIQTILEANQYALAKELTLSGTMKFDDLTASFYARRPLQ